MKFKFLSFTLLFLTCINVYSAEELQTKELLGVDKDALIGLLSLSQPYQHKNAPQKASHIYPCPQCDKIFPSQAKVQRHNNSMHFDVKLFVCHLCNKKFARMDNLKIHLDHKTCIKNETLPYQLIKTNIATNILTPRKEVNIKNNISKKLTCLNTECSKTFDNLSSLKTHMVVHTGTKPFSCIFCPNKFSQHGGIKSHIISMLGKNDPNHTIDQIKIKIMQPQCDPRIKRTLKDILTGMQTNPVISTDI